MSSPRLDAVGTSPLSAGQAWLWATLLSAALDGLQAAIVCALRGIAPQRAFQAIAAGLLGKPAAFAGGAATTALGLALLLFICAVIAALYVGASRKLLWLRERPWRWGALYGGGVFLVMNFAVVPLSRAAPSGPRNPLLLANCLAACVLCVGIPVAWLARRADRSPGFGREGQGARAGASIVLAS